MSSTGEVRYHLTNRQTQQRVAQMILPEGADARKPLLACVARKLRSDEGINLGWFLLT